VAQEQDGGGDQGVGEGVGEDGVFDPAPASLRLLKKVRMQGGARRAE